MANILGALDSFAGGLARGATAGLSYSRERQRDELYGQLQRDQLQALQEQRAQDMLLKRLDVMTKMAALPTTMRRQLAPVLGGFLGPEVATTIGTLPESEEEIRRKQIETGEGPFSVLSPKDRARILAGFSPEATPHFAPQR